VVSTGTISGHMLKSLEISKENFNPVDNLGCMNPAHLHKMNNYRYAWLKVVEKYSMFITLTIYLETHLEK
jgi:hypothetical protein